MISTGMLDSDDWNACALPWNVPMTVPGMAMSRAACVIASTAWPSATPGRTLKVSVTDGNCPWCVTWSGPTLLVSISTNVERGTAAPVSGDFT